MPLSPNGPCAPRAARPCTGQAATCSSSDSGMSKFAWTASTSSWSSSASISAQQAPRLALAAPRPSSSAPSQLGRLDLDPGLARAPRDRGQVAGRLVTLSRSSSAATSSAPASIAGIRSSSRVALAVDEDDALLLELPGDRSGLAEAAAVLVEGVADLGAGAVAVVGQRLDEDRRAAGPVALVDDALDRVAAVARAGAAVDRPLDVVLGHRVVARLLDRRRRG